jgi:hypothetical protein
MKELWRKTAKLFLKYPILWLPYVCVHLLNASLDSLRHARVIWIYRWLTTGHSVLGSFPVQIYNSAATAKTAWISGLMQWSLLFLKICLDTVALVVTAALVTKIMRGEQPRLRAVLAELQDYPKRILGYSLKLYFLDLVFATFVSLPAIRLSHWVSDSTATTGWSRAANFALLRGQGLISLILFAWIMIPIAIRLLRTPGTEPPSTDEKRLGRYFVILMGVGGFALSSALFPVLLKLVALRAFPKQAYASSISLVLSFPSLLGNIALALIAVGGDWNLSGASISEKRRERWRALFPLHFDEREQH